MKKVARLYILFPLILIFSCHEKQTSSNQVQHTPDKIKVDTPVNTTASNTKAKEPQTAIRWEGHYSCNFLRLKEESADPRAWGMIYLDIDKSEAHFRLDTYAEEIKKDLKIIHKGLQEIELIATDNEKSKLAVTFRQNKYFLQGSLMEAIVAEKEIYELKKRSVKQ